jgi:hypothetical protein
MGISELSFQLTPEQLDAINRHFSQRKEAYMRANEDIGTVSIKVEFEWVPGLGRFVTAHFDGEINGCEIEEAGESSAR